MKNKVLVVVAILSTWVGSSLVAQWTTMSEQVTGTLITAAEWNKIVNNFGALSDDGSELKIPAGRLTWREVTLSPDTKGACDSSNEGELVKATDFNRLYICRSSAWEDLNEASDPRGRIEFFDTLTPPDGWAECDGSTVSRSTSSGGTTNITLPNYSTAAYVKAKTSTHTVGPTAASGSTNSQGSHTHSDGTLSVASHSHSSGTYSVNSHDHSITRGQCTDCDLNQGTGTDNVVVSVNTPTGTSSPSVSGNSGSSSPDVTGSTGSGGSHSHTPNTLELRRSELRPFMRL